MSLMLAIALLLPLMSGCNLPQVKAEDRLFLPLSLDFLGEYRLPKLEFAGTPVGGLSGITYDRQRDRLYAISDDRSERAPARFYTLKLTLAGRSPGQPVPAQPPQAQASPTQASLTQASPTQASLTQASQIQAIQIEQVTPLLDGNGQPYPAGTLDPEGIALSPRNTLYISSEGVSRDGIAPFIHEYDLTTGRLRTQLPIPDRFLPQSIDHLPYGVQDNQGFESLTLAATNTGTSQIEPFRVFAATESAIHQDLPVPSAPTSTVPDRSMPPAPSPVPPPTPVRLLHYLVGDDLPTLLAEHLYLIDPAPEATGKYGLTELLVFDQAGHFLSLERAFGLNGFSARLYQMIPGGASDTSTIIRLRGDLSRITPVYKQLLLDLSHLGIALDNLEGMTLGPRLADGSQSLLLVSDDNFNEMQTTQFLLFRINTQRRSPETKQ